MVKSKTEVEFHKGFEQDVDDIEQFIKQVPVYDKTHGYTLAPYVKYIQDGYKPYRTRDVTTVKFKFHFFDTAEIEVLLYGTAYMNTTTATSTTTETTTTASRKYLHTHIKRV